MQIARIKMPARILFLQNRIMVSVYQEAVKAGGKILQVHFEMNLCRLRKVWKTLNLVKKISLTITLVCMASPSFAQEVDLIEEDSSFLELPMDTEMGGIEALETNDTQNEIPVSSEPSLQVNPEEPPDEYVLKETPVENMTSDLVEWIHPQSYFSTYKERRTTHGLLFSLARPSVLMDNMSTIENDTETFYEDLYGDTPVAFPEIFIGYKLNLPLVALHFDVGYAVFETTEGISGQKRSLKIERPTARAGLILDDLFDEPYVAPYVNASVWQMLVTESNEVDEVSYTTDFGFTYSAGALIQLNWIDKNAAFQARKNFGIQNTYLDLFVLNQQTTLDEEDPDTSTELTFGAGIRIEY